MANKILIRMIKHTDFSLKNFNTFGVDAKTSLFIEFNSEAELEKILNEEIDVNNKRFLILGEGSNVLFSEDFHGTVLRNSIEGIQIIYEDERKAVVKSGAGTHWDDLVEFCVRKNLWGIENLSLIPGTVGAAPIQNIGAYGAELKDVLVSVRGFKIGENKFIEMPKETLELSYRNSIFKTKLKNKFIITYVTIELDKSGKPNLSYTGLAKYFNGKNIKEIGIEEIRNAVIEIRRSKLPDPEILGSAGSFFKNPVVNTGTFNKLKLKYPDIVAYKVDEDHWKIPAGWLIDNAGLRGFRTGNTGTYEKQALVIVNYGNASGKEILDLAKFIQTKVKEKYQIELEPEVNII